MVVAYPALADNTDSVSWSTFFGGSLGDVNLDITSDVNGDVYVVCATSSTDFPTTAGAFDQTYNGGSGGFPSPYGDGVVAKFSGATGALIYATYIGGSADEELDSILVNAAGEAYVLGVTASADFPTTLGAYDTTFNGVSDAVLFKLSADGSTLLFSTFLGGSSSEEVWEKTRLGLDPTGNIYVTGHTYSTDFPTTAGAYDETHNSPGKRDVFVTKFNPTATTLMYSTLLGGSDRDQGMGMTVNTSGEAYIVGYTHSANYPTTVGAYDETHNGGGRDVYVTKLNAVGSGLVYSTVIGGTGSDHAWDMVLDSADNIYVTGKTNSPLFPTTPGAYDTSLGDGDAFVLKLNDDGTDLIASTLLGGAVGAGGTIALGLARDAGGNIWISGETAAADLPTTAEAFQSDYGGGTRDGYFAQFNPTLSNLMYCSYAGGAGKEPEAHVAVDGFGNVMISGQTLSSNFYTSDNAIDKTFGGDGVNTGDVYVMRLTPGTITAHFLEMFEDEGDALYTSMGEDFATADLDGDGLADRYQLGLVAYVLSVQTHPHSTLVHALYAAHLDEIRAEANYAAELAAYEHVLAALLVTSDDMITYYTAEFSLTGSYSSFVITKAANEPFSGSGDLDGDGQDNVTEYTNNGGSGGSIHTFISAALNTALDGSALPAANTWVLLFVIAGVLLLARFALRKGPIR
jgi:hypothetical protein